MYLAVRACLDVSFGLASPVLFFSTLELASQVVVPAAASLGFYMMAYSWILLCCVCVCDSELRRGAFDRCMLQARGS